ncbi:MAG: hypothetical protein DBY30_06925 [Verrucomicrobia bacterium]|nr:MAG: hypothetical protein DBY30_06925 [Verrucomicrobiota bacterium]
MRARRAGRKKRRRRGQRRTRAAGSFFLRGFCLCAGAEFFNAIRSGRAAHSLPRPERARLCEPASRRRSFAPLPVEIFSIYAFLFAPIKHCGIY